MERSSFIASDEFAAARRRAIAALLAARGGNGCWTGRLSSSALSTATALTALRLVDGEAHAAAIRSGADWLAATQREDGSWGDTPASHGNLSTTLLCWASLASLVDAAGDSAAQGPHEAAAGRAAGWIVARTGGLDAARIAAALAAIYGRDRTFSVPILTHVALCGRFGDPRERATWAVVPQLPFELAALPQAWFRLVDMQVVSYALPALIAIGQVRHAVAPAAGPAGWVRSLAAAATLRTLATIQPENGGFLEATPLTSFVTMSLAALGLGSHDVARRGVAFLGQSQRADGSWPIDTNIATWGTTLAVQALAAGGRLAEHLTARERERIRFWLLGQQWRRPHPATGAAPGGWAWTDLPGGVPDADDTSGAVAALATLEAAERRPLPSSVRDAGDAGLAWLAGLANRDGGIPTFCRGWGRLPFDTSCPDITAHFLRATESWSRTNRSPLSPRITRAERAARRYLAATQGTDGAWTPLWFGNEHHPAQENPVYGTARVVLATHDPRGVAWLMQSMHDDGGVGGGPGLPVSVEETAVVVEALAAAAVPHAAHSLPDDLRRRAAEAVDRGARWLVEHTDGGRAFPTAPIGLYFAKLWYAEDLYPLVFTVAAFERAATVTAGP
ncbi:MAG: prenyltransferase/squalene oxidase repeat-containing protein [Planctomycetaceae bacterium]